MRCRKCHLGIAHHARHFLLFTTFQASCFRVEIAFWEKEREKKKHAPWEGGENLGGSQYLAMSSLSAVLPKKDKSGKTEDEYTCCTSERKYPSEGNSKVWGSCSKATTTGFGCYQGRWSLDGSKEKPDNSRALLPPSGQPVSKRATVLWIASSDGLCILPPLKSHGLFSLHSRHRIILGLLGIISAVVHVQPTEQ